MDHSTWDADWSLLPGQATFDTQHIAAVSRTPNNLDLFVIGNDNHVWTNAWIHGNPNGGWDADFHRLPGQAVFDRATQHIAAVLRTPNNLDVFVIGNDNHVWTNAWTHGNPDGGWDADFHRLPGQAVFDRATQKVAVVSRAPGNLDLFAIDKGSQVRTNAWTQGNPNGGWDADFHQLPGVALAVFDGATQHVVAVSRAPGNLDLFVAGAGEDNDHHIINDGSVWTIGWTQGDPNGGWKPDWSPLPGQRLFNLATQHVAAVSRTPANLELFVIGGGVWTRRWRQR